MIFTCTKNRNSYWSDSFPSDCNPAIEIEFNKDNLVLCYGDSWTWGDSLGKSDASLSIDDIEFRKQHLFGRIIANALDADFANQAMPGAPNYWIHDRLQILVDNDVERLSTNYSKIYIIVTLTELGRELNFDNYQKEFKKFYDWTTDPDWSGEKMLMQAEKFDLIKLKNTQNQLPRNCKLIVARNFTNTYAEHTSIVDNLISKNWSDVLFQAQGLQPTSGVRLVGIGLHEFNKFVVGNSKGSMSYKQWFANCISVSASKQIDLLEQSIYNYKKASKHPTPEGHNLWANYLLNFIKD